MNKKEFITYVSEISGLPQRKLRDALDALTDGVVSAIRSGNTVQLNGFGVFTVKRRKPMRGRNKWTGEPIDIPSKKYPYFSPGTNLQEAVKEGGDNWRFEDP